MSLPVAARAKALLAGALVLAATATAVQSQSPATGLQGDLDQIFDHPSLSRALVAVDIRSLRDNRVLYQRNAALRVIPGSVLKLVTAATAAERLGWTYKFETRLEAVGTIENGVLRGDLVVVGGGDPSIGAQDLKGAALFDEWADALRAAGVRRVDGRIVGDDNAFEDEPLGGGWAWDYLNAGYAAPSGALSYNENVVVIRVTPGVDAGRAADVQVGPPGHGLSVERMVATGVAGSTVALNVTRPAGQRILRITGSLPAGGPTVIRTSTIENPTLYFAEALRVQLMSRGIRVSAGAWDIDEIGSSAVTGPRRLIARRESEPLSSLLGYAMKVSQNFYGEMLLKAAGRRDARETGSTERGRQAVRDVLSSWQIALEPLVMRDGSGLSRYNYVSADLLSGVLVHVWLDERLRGPFVAALPVGGRDGTLGSRMRNPVLDRQVQAKTGTLDNVRSLAGYLHTSRGETLAFAMIANNFTAPVSEIDGLMERALERLAP
jgi:D-alanyl-D-alanine carboxypeptidase/D-alanyl-D-alanine-endopeptidase (penicillin-binding protein 4)